ncbi:hypothetical protein CASFOL_032131 [Castilleja foliolosa]|uniref:Transmembrane protein n=1 Tax=Castilleja foliolosa TaxID=1961234 RepID=A0ABD3C0J6_9LAMI
MEMKASLIVTLLLFILLLVGPGFSRRTLGVKNMNSENIYEIDYRGPETHTYIPPPNLAGARPSIHHQTSTAHRHKSKRHGKKIVG